MIGTHEQQRPTRRFTTDEVLRMLEAGILGSDEPVELLDGELVLMTPQGPAHSSLTVILRNRLTRAYTGRAFVRDHSSMDAGPTNLPEPDLAVVRGAPEDYFEHLPTGPETLLVVEIAVTTRRDAQAKKAIYARSKVPEYWIVDVPGRWIEVYAEPVDEVYTRAAKYGEADSVTPPDTDASWVVRELLPPAR